MYTFSYFAHSLVKYMYNDNVSIVMLLMTFLPLFHCCDITNNNNSDITNLMTGVTI